MTILHQTILQIMNNCELENSWSHYIAATVRSDTAKFATTSTLLASEMVKMSENVESL